MLVPILYADDAADYCQIKLNMPRNQFSIRHIVAQVLIVVEIILLRRADVHSYFRLDRGPGAQLINRRPPDCATEFGTSDSR